VNATNVYIGDGEYADQTATASLAQEQDVEQANVNEQGAAIAIAVGENSTAGAFSSPTRATSTRSDTPTLRT